MTPLGMAVSAALLHFVWQGTAIAVLCWMMLVLMWRRSAASRYVVACGAMLLMAVTPAVTAWTLYRDTVVWTIDSAAGEFEWIGAAQAWAVPVWACGVMFFALRMTWGCAQVAQLRRRGGPAGEAVGETVTRLAERLGVGRPVRVLVSTLAESPGVVGWLRPVILLPVSTIAGLTPEQLEAVLAHELAHIRRHDYAVNLVQMGVESLLFYHPAVWWVSARIRREREYCCDDLATSVCGGPLVYATALTAVEKMRGAVPAPAVGMTRVSLLDRVRRLAGVDVEQTPPRAASVVALLMVALCVVLGANWAWAQQAPPAPPAGPAPQIPPPMLVPPTQRPAPASTAPLEPPRLLIMRPGPWQRVEQMAAILEFAAEEQVLVDKTHATAVREMLVSQKHQAQARVEELSRHADGGEERKDEAARNLKEIQNRLDRAIAADRVARLHDLQLQSLKLAWAGAHDRAGKPTDEQAARRYEGELEVFANMLESVVDGAGKTINGVEFRDVPQDTVTRLGSVLPLKSGEVYSHGSLHRMAQAVRDFDPRLRFYFLKDDGRLVLRIQPQK